MIKGKIKVELERILEARFGLKPPETAELGVNVVEFSRDRERGDFSVPGALKLAGKLGKNPREIAGELKEAFEEGGLAPDIASVDIAGPGFVNITLSRAAYTAAVRSILDTREAYGRGNTGEGVRVNVEYVSANPTGPLTVAHGRQAAIGSVLASLLEWSGFEVTREYYLNDTGNQVRVLGLSIYARYAELNGVEYDFPEEGYRGDYITDIARRVSEKVGDRYVDDDVAGTAFMGEYGAAVLLSGLKDVLTLFRCPFDVFSSQKKLEDSGDVEKFIDDLRKVSAVYEKDDALWFASEGYGDTQDRVLIKADGEYTYRTPDIAYHKDKLEREHDRLIDLWGPDHHSHVACVKSGLSALGYDPESLTVLLVQYCTLLRNGEKIKQSTRGGTFVTLAELVEEVGVDAARYFFLDRKVDSHLDFDVSLAVERSSQNPVFYAQYMHARITGIFTRAAGCGLMPQEKIDLAEAGDDDLTLVWHLLKFPSTVEQAAHTLEPVKLVAYAYDLASFFQRYYEHNRVVDPDAADVSSMRLSLVSVARTVLANALAILGINAPEKM